jgi:hypothetical protein
MLPALLQATSETPPPGEDEVAHDEEADHRGDRNGDDLGHVARQVGENHFVHKG